MKQEEARELMKDKFDEITQDEYCNLINKGETKIRCKEGYLFFKPKPQFPKVFEDTQRKVIVHSDSSIYCESLTDGDSVCFKDSLPLLYEAVELSKKIRGKE